MVMAELENADLAESTELEGWTAVWSSNQGLAENIEPWLLASEFSLAILLC